MSTQQNTQVNVRMSTAIIIVLLLLLGATIWLTMRAGQDATFHKSLAEVLRDSIEYYQDQDGLQVAHISALQMEVRHFDDILKTNNKQLVDLARSVERYKKRLRDATSVTTEHTYEIPANIRSICDSILDARNANTDIEFISNGWITLNLNTDTDKFNLGITDKLLLWHSYDKPKFSLFNRYTPLTVYAKSMNPHVKVTELTSLTLDIPNARRFGFSAGVGPFVAIDGRVRLGFGVMASYTIW